MSNIIVISGPSGCGKSTLIQKLIQECSDIVFSVSHTTRLPRGEEQNGKEYHFVQPETFEKMIANDEFVEWANVHNKYYGTSLQEVKEKSSGSRILILDIDVQGAEIMRKKFPKALYVMVAPPSMKELEKRIIKRENAISNEFRQRLVIARKELARYAIYDYIIINDHLEDAYNVLRSIYTSCKHTRERNEHYIKEMLASEIQ